MFVGVQCEGWSVLQEDEIYDKQFGQAFAAQALDPNDRRNVLRDDYALEIAGVQCHCMCCHTGACFLLHRYVY